MIARVRIAPLEQWCSEFRVYAADNPRLLSLVGMEIDIDPRTMLVGPTMDSADWEQHSKARRWVVYAESSARMRHVAGLSMDTLNRLWICEHLLEMD